MLPSLSFHSNPNVELRSSSLKRKCSPLFLFEFHYRITVIKFDKSVHPYFCSNSNIELRSSGSNKVLRAEIEGANTFFDPDDTVIRYWNLSRHRWVTFLNLITVRNRSNFTGYLRRKKFVDNKVFAPLFLVEKKSSHPYFSYWSNT